MIFRLSCPKYHFFFCRKINAQDRAGPVRRKAKAFLPSCSFSSRHGSNPGSFFFPIPSPSEGALSVISPVLSGRLSSFDQVASECYYIYKTQRCGCFCPSNVYTKPRSAEIKRFCLSAERPVCDVTIGLHTLQWKYSDRSI